jgi:CHAT domain-containing protein
LIAGHGALHYLPFAALHDGERFLLDRYELSFLPSASTLKFIGRIDASGKPGTVLAFGNPDLGDPRYDLAFAEREAREVSALFPDSALFVRRDASKRSLLEFGTGFRYLHFATHGKFDAANPLGSALLLATDSAGNERDRLTIGELYSMRLDADLVTLSACETGLGKVANGDDVVGLVRGFLYAGANQIVSTLWEIDDEATSSLMTDFYAKLKAGTNKTRALREAQLAARAKYPHPAYWAAFQITGEPARRAATPAPGAKRRTN